MFRCQNFVQELLKKGNENKTYTKQTLQMIAIEKSVFKNIFKDKSEYLPPANEVAGR